MRPGRVRIGSLFTGYGGLDLAAARVLGGDTVWMCEHEPASPRRAQPRQGAARILAHRFPGVVNLGDVRRDWAAVPDVDVTVGGYPCPGESQAGLRLGADDPRWMWPAYFDLIATMRPRLAVGENVRGHVSLSLRYVVADLQSIGYAVVWGVLAASDVGACHERKRVFWAAWDETLGAPAGVAGEPFAELDGGDWVQPDLFGGTPATRWPANGAAHDNAAYTMPVRSDSGARAAGLLPTPRTTDGTGSGRHGSGGMDLRTTVAVLLPTPTTQDGANVGGPSQVARHTPPLNVAALLLPTPKATDGTNGGPNQRGSAGDLMLPAAVQPERWGQFAAAVARWEAVLGRAAPPACEDNGRGGQRLSPGFAEWMMGLPGGWVTQVPGLTRNEKLRAIGNGVVPQQAAAALHHLLCLAPARAQQPTYPPATGAAA